MLILCQGPAQTAFKIWLVKAIAWLPAIFGNRTWPRPVNQHLTLGINEFGAAVNDQVPAQPVGNSDCLEYAHDFIIKMHGTRQIIERRLALQHADRQTMHRQQICQRAARRPQTDHNNIKINFFGHQGIPPPTTFEPPDWLSVLCRTARLRIQPWAVNHRRCLFAQCSCLEALFPESQTQSSGMCNRSCPQKLGPTSVSSGTHVSGSMIRPPHPVSMKNVDTECASKMMSYNHWCGDQAYRQWHHPCSAAGHSPARHHPDGHIQP